MKDKNTTDEKKKRKIGPWIVGGIALVGLTVAGGLLYGQSKKRNPGSSSNPAPSSGGTAPQAPAKPKTGGTVWKGDGFPLAYGSSGPNVVRLQMALKNEGFKQLGRDLLPRYGADGKYGNETRAALSALGIPEVVDAATFAARFGPAGTSSAGGSSAPQTQSMDWRDAAQRLRDAAKAQNLAGVLAILRIVRTVDDYKGLRLHFMTTPWKGTANYTPVTALMTTFSGSDKQAIHRELIRLGLKYREGQYHLSGLPGRPSGGRLVRLVVSAPLWNDSFEITVPAGQIIGRELRSGGGFTEVINGAGNRFTTRTENLLYA